MQGLEEEEEDNGSTTLFYGKTHRLIATAMRVFGAVQLQAIHNPSVELNLDLIGDDWD